MNNLKNKSLYYLKKDVWLYKTYVILELTDNHFGGSQIFLELDRAERHEFGSRFLCYCW